VKAIHRKLTTVLVSIANSLNQVKEWRDHFATGEISCQDEFRPGRLPHVLGKALSDFLEEFPFASVEDIAQHFGQSKHIIKEILQQELWLRRFSRRCVPHSVLEAEEADRIAMINDPLSVLHRQANYWFSRIAIDDEFWFLY
jgi:hypothetical protein